MDPFPQSFSIVLITGKREAGKTRANTATDPISGKAIGAAMPQVNSLSSRIELLPIIDHQHEGPAAREQGAQKRDGEGIGADLTARL